MPDNDASFLERSAALTAVALSDGRRDGVRLITGEQRSFGLNAALSLVQVPYPPAGAGWTRRSVTAGVALQCSPSKDAVVGFRLGELSARELRALTLVEARVALGWIGGRWPGLVGEIARLLPELTAAEPEMTGQEMLRRAVELAREPGTLVVDPLLGCLPVAHTAPAGSPRRCAAGSAGCRGPATRSGCPGRIRCRSAVTAGSAIPTCRRRAGRRTTSSTPPPRTGPVSPTRSGTRGRTLSCATTSPCW
ncbi:hypothetical protein H7H37_14415, partial [Mycolicibacterium insubricum]|nr:hypothetical protein [Mycolicibacterium insubricum]